MRRSWVARRIGASAVVVAMAITVAACGGASTKAVAPVPATTSTTAPGRGARQAAFRQCMQTHGVTVPSGALGFGGRGAPGSTSSSVPTTTTLPPGVTPQQWQSALTACAAQLPGRGNLQNNPQFQLYYNCLQTYLMTHGGTTLPPLGQGGPGGGGPFGGGGPGGAAGAAGGAASTATTNPMLQAARDHCAALRPVGGGGGGGSTTTSTAPSATP